MMLFTVGEDCTDFQAGCVTAADCISNVCKLNGKEIVSQFDAFFFRNNAKK